MRWVAFAAVCAINLVPLPAAAQNYSPEWHAVSSRVAGETVTIKAGGFVDRGRLLPRALVTIAEPAITAKKGRVLLHAGGYLVRMGASPFPTYCTWRHGTKPVSYDIKLAEPGAFLCLLDKDADGRFDHHYFKFSWAAMFMAAYFDKNNKPHEPLVTPLAYQRAPAERFRDMVSVGTVWTTRTRGGKTEMCFTNILANDAKPRETERLKLTTAAGGPQQCVPGDATKVAAFGSDFTVISASATQATLRIDKPFPTTPVIVAAPLSPF